METMEKVEHDKKLIEQYVEETVDSIIFGNFSVQSLKKFHKEVNEKNRQIVKGEYRGFLNEADLQFMHQVTKHAVKAVGTQQRLNTQRARRSIRLRNSVVE